MDLITIYKENFTIFIGIFVTLAVMGITTLYDRHKEKGGASFSLKYLKIFSRMNSKNSKITTTRSKGLKQFSEFSKKVSNLIQNKTGSSQKKSTLAQKSSSKNFLEQMGAILIKAKDAGQKHFVGFRNKISSLSSASKNGSDKEKKEKFVPLSDAKKADLKSGVTDKINNLDKAVESKKNELDFDDDLLTEMSTSSTLAANNPELKTKGPSLEPLAGEVAPGFDVAFDNDFTMDESEFAIKVDGLDDAPVENSLNFNENIQEIKFGDEKDNLLDSLKKDIVVNKEKKINFMDRMQGENLDVKQIKSDLEGVLKELNKFRQYHKS